MTAHWNDGRPCPCGEHHTPAADLTTDDVLTAAGKAVTFLTAVLVAFGLGWRVVGRRG